MVARAASMFGCYDSYSYRLWSLANVWSQFPLNAGIGKSLSPGSVADDVGAGGGGPGDCFIKCPHCQKGYPGFQALKEHVESSHPPPQHLGADDTGASQPTSPVGSPAPNNPVPGGGYACSQCNMRFMQKDQLEKHELLHSPNAQVESSSFKIRVIILHCKYSTQKCNITSALLKMFSFFGDTRYLVNCINLNSLIIKFIY
ncbi:hypothetical protein L9F63_020446, partial [Diploptera punctata]